MIGIIGALEMEIELLKDSLALEATLTKAGLEFYQGTLAGKEVVLVKSGIGKVNAALCTQILADEFAVDKVIFTGVAGAVDPELEVKDIVISTELIQHDVDVTAFGDCEPGEIPQVGTAFVADEELIELAEKAGDKISAEEGLKVVTGRILSGDQFISDQEKVDWLRETFNGYCTEMEGAAVAQTAYLNEIPFLIIRSISDKADGEADISFDKFARQAANHSRQMVMEIINGLE
jgi:adenosylhomocysteine nucleosidase